VSRLKAAEIVEEPSSLVVWKFGGSSVADHDRLRAVAERLVTAQRQDHRLAAALGVPQFSESSQPLVTTERDEQRRLDISATGPEHRAARQIGSLGNGIEIFTDSPSSDQVSLATTGGLRHGNEFLDTTWA
jgi:aspartokinase